MLGIAHYTRTPGNNHRPPTSIITTTKPTALPRSTPPSTTPDKIPSSSTQHPSSAARTITDPQSSPQSTVQNDNILLTFYNLVFPPPSPKLSIFNKFKFGFTDQTPIPSHLKMKDQNSPASPLCLRTKTDFPTSEIALCGCSSGLDLPDITLIGRKRELNHSCEGCRRVGQGGKESE